MLLRYLYRHKKYFYFRKRVPRDLEHFFPQPYLKYSLKTKDPKIAKELCRHWLSRVEKSFLLIRSGVLTPEQIQTHIHQQFPTRQESIQHLKPRMLFDVVDLFLQEHISLGKWTEKSAMEVTCSLRMFKEVIGNRPLRSIDRGMMVDYVEKLSRLPSNMRKKAEYRGKSVKGILESNVSDPMSTAAVNKYLSRANALLIWSVRQGYIDRNPAEGLTVAARKLREDEERSAYNHEDMKLLLVSLGEERADYPERYWVPLIGMYSGLRLNEICQLHVEDIREIDGNPCFDINDEGEKRLKTLSSRRLVPVHPKLLSLGFQGYVERMRGSGCPRLWMNLVCARDGYGHHFSRWFGRFNRKHITADPKKCFHSFRHTVANTLKQAGVAESVIAEILGHTNHSITTGRYGKRYEPRILLEALAKIDY